MPQAADMTPPQVAAALRCTPPTVRALIEDGLLPAVKTKKAKRTYYSISSSDVEAYVEKYGTFSERRARRVRPTPRTVPSGAQGNRQSVVEELRALRDLVESRVPPSSEAQAEVVALREALQLQRAAMAVLLEADDDRSDGLKLIQQAMRSFSDADAKRKRAVELLDEVVGSVTLPGTAAALTDGAAE